MTKRSIILLLGLVLSIGAAGCQASSARSDKAGASATPVAKIVFVGKDEACDCTRKAIDASWAALEQALGTPAKLPVERIAVDTDEAKVEPYREQKAIMALPAIYFVDAANAVVAQLQGEVTADQIRAVLP